MMRTRSHWRSAPVLLWTLLVGMAALGPSAGRAVFPAYAQEACSFQFGFQVLQTMIPDEVGACLENERADPLTGDTEQRTTGGLLVWRRSDNYTAFTDGRTTWINGPDGLVSRPSNGPPFSWEVAAVAGTPVVTEPPLALPRDLPGMLQAIERSNLGVRLFLILALLGLIVAGLRLGEMARVWAVILIPIAVLLLWLLVLSHLDSALVAIVVAAGVVVALVVVFRAYAKARERLAERSTWRVRLVRTPSWHGSRRLGWGRRRR